MGDSDKTVLIVVLIVGGIAVVACVLSSIAVSRQPPSIIVNPPSQGGGGGGGGDGSSGGSGGNTQLQPPPKMNRVYLIHTGHSYGAHEYFDKTGYIRGFNFEMIDLVCKAAGIDCRPVWDKYVNCWDSQAGKHASGGVGLMGQWYDGCQGWYTTVDRIHVFSFSAPHAKPPLSYFYVKNSDTTFNPNNINGKRIGFLDGWASDEKCLARQSAEIDGAFLEEGFVTHYTDPDALVAAINSGTVQAGFTTYETMQKYIGASGSLKQLPKSIQCMLAGNAMMTRKDSEFTALWNSGFQKVRGNGQFATLCKQANEDHKEHGTIDCLL